MTNSFLYDNVIFMFAQKFVAGLRKPFDVYQGRGKRNRQRVDLVAEQVKKMLATSDQKLILMVRG